MKNLCVVLSIACMLFVFGIAGGSDAGTITAGQSLLLGSLGMAGTIIFARLGARE